jgi:hypothetical protein
MAATVTGTFTLIDRASSKLKKIEEQAKRTDKAIASVGDRLDSVGTDSQMRQHEELGRKLRMNEDNAEALNKRLGGTVGATDAVAAAAGRASGKMRGFGSAMVLVGTAMAALLPVIIDVGGALGALIGSLGRAAAGASALAVGGIGVLGVALAGLAGTILPTVSNLGKLSQAFTAVSDAQRQYGKNSKEARDAMKEMAQAQKGMENFDVKRGMAVVSGFDSLKNDWSKLTARGQSSILQTLLNTMRSAQNMLPMLARNANEIALATGKSLDVFFTRLDGPTFRRFVDTMTDVYETVAKPLGNIFANIGEALGNVSIAASDELTRLVLLLEDTTKGWLDASKNIGGMRSSISAASRETGDWYRLIKSAFDWMVALFGPGADQGQGLVQAMTDKLNEQTEWFRRNPATLREFYETSSEGVRGLARLLGDIAPTLLTISEAMRPVVTAFQELVNLLSEIKLGNINALTLAVTGFGVGKIGGALGGIFGGLRNRMGYITGGAGAGMAGAGVAGMASPGLGGVPGGVVPVFVTNAGGIGGMASPGRGGGGAGGPLIFGGPGGMVGGPSSPARKPWWAKVPGLRQAGTSMTTVGAQAGMMTGATGVAARVGLGAARFAGKAFLPLSLLLGLGDFLSTEGNVLQRLQGAASGATFGLVPKPRSAEEISQAALQNLTDDKGGVRLDPRTGRVVGRPTRANFQAERSRIISEADTGYSFAGRPGQRRVVGRPQLSPQQRQEMRAINMAEGQFRGDEIAQGMAVYMRAGKGRRGITEATNDIFREIRRAGNQAQAREIAEGSLRMAQAAAKGNPKLKGEYETLAKGVEKRLDSMGKNVSVVNGTIYTKSQKKWQQIRKALVGEAEQARQDVSNEFTNLQRQAVGQLTAFGFSRAEARNIVSNKDASGSAPGSGAPGPIGPQGGGGGSTRNRQGIPQPAGAYGMRIPGYAGGGRLAGQGHKDTVPLTLGMAAPGELIVNRHTEGRVNSMLGMFGTNLGKEVGNENVPHSATPSPGRESRGRGPGRPHVFHARGGRIGAVPDADGALPGLDVLGHYLKKKFGLSVTSGLRPGAITSSGNPSDHGWGGAIDVSNGVTTPQMDAAHAWVQANLGPALKQVLYRTMVGGNHYDHIHIALNEAYARNPERLMALIGGGGAGMSLPAGSAGPTPRVNLRAGRSRQRGIPGAMAQGAMNALASGMTQGINRRIGGRGVGPAGGGRLVGASVYGGPNDATSGTEGYKGDQLPGTMTYAELGYSGGDASSARLLGGLPYKAPLRISYGGKSVVARKRDIGTGGGDVQGRPRAIDLWHETAAALGFPFGVGLVKVAKLAQGGRLGGAPAFGGWYGEGGKFTADKPTLIGVGEKGKETVQITPAGKSAGGSGGRGIQIGSIKIENHRKGDIKRQIKEEISQAFDELDREIRNDTGGGIV